MREQDFIDSFMTADDESGAVSGGGLDIGCSLGVYSGLHVEVSKFRVVKFGRKDIILKRASADPCR